MEKSVHILEYLISHDLDKDDVASKVPVLIDSVQRLSLLRLSESDSTITTVDGGAIPQNPHEKPTNNVEPFLFNTLTTFCGSPISTLQCS